MQVTMYSFSRVAWAVEPFLQRGAGQQQEGDVQEDDAEFDHQVDRSSGGDAV
jgi:hypothetical protein